MPRKGEKSATSQSDAEMTDSVMEMTESDETLVHRYGLNVFDEQDPTERRKIREQYRELIERAQQGRELAAQLSPEDLEAAVSHATSIYDTVKAPLEAAYDSEYLAVLSALGKQKIQSLQTNFRVFDQAEFADKLVRSLRISTVKDKAEPESTSYFALGDTTEESDDEASSGSQARTSTNRLIDDAKWLKFGRFVNKTVLHAPSLKYLYGAFDPGAVEIAVKQRKPRDPQTALPAKVTQVTTSKTANEDDHLEATTRSVQRVDVALKAVIHKNGSVGYWEFVTHPTSFGKTVENMFYFSFLIKDGLAGIKFDENELPIIYIPDASERAEAAHSSNTNQFVTNFDMATWREIIRVFDISEPMLDEEKIEKSLRIIEKAKKKAGGK